VGILISIIFLSLFVVSNNELNYAVGKAPLLWGETLPKRKEKTDEQEECVYREQL
jgi:hypothetical protein